MRIAIGIHAHGDRERLRDTLAAVGDVDADIVVLANDVVEELGDLGVPQLTASGVPGCFNRFARFAAAADVLVFLENGTVPAPGCIARLVEAVTADGAGLAGPSTNRAWNEQAAFPSAGRADLRATAAAAAERFGAEVRSLTPLHSLGDFCFAVTREVVATIGGADPGYADGPCWELEYAARAARAGFAGLWVCGAYAFRHPVSAWREHAEALHFDASRRRYQDALCGLRLRGLSDDYRPHCDGDACEHFAPREEIVLERPLSAPAEPRSRTALVSCIMATGGRLEFALQAIRYFDRQDYPARELVIVDDGDGSLERVLPAALGIRYVHVPPGLSIGAKRNLGCEAARGEFIAQWDDDDWYGPRRLAAQLAPLLGDAADISALNCASVLELDAWRWWTCPPELHRRLFVGDVAGGTLVFRKSVWERLARYPDASLAEDAALLAHALRRGARLARIAGDAHYVYLRHAANTWRLTIDATSGWRPIAEPLLPAGDRAFYAARSRHAPPTAPAQPLVSCLLPTSDRRAHVGAAIRWFQRQDHARRELVILDDGDDRIADLVPADDRIRYVASDEHLVLGDKRNRLCELARGDVLLHWDDDDWHAPHRISQQLAELDRHDADLCGPGRMLFAEAGGRRAWLYEYPRTRRAWIAGSGLCYRRELWERSPFASVRVGEDTRFVWSDAARRVAVLEDHRFVVGLVHPGNTSPKPTSANWWTPRPVDELRALMGEDFTCAVRLDSGMTAL